MNEETLTRAMSLIAQAADIHRMTENIYVSVDVDRHDVSMNVSRFLGGRQYVQRFYTNSYGIKSEAVIDQDLTKARAYLNMLRRMAELGVA